jgi:hypothetical protein
MKTDIRDLLDIIRTDNELLDAEARAKAFEKASTATFEENEELPKILKEGGRAWRKRERERKLAIDAGIERAMKRKKASQKYYRKNKGSLNSARTIRNMKPEYIYAKAKQRAREKGIEWEFTLDSWLDKWSSTPRILDEDTGFYVTAWSKRGPVYNRDAQLVRTDTNMGWDTGNTSVVYQGEVLTEEEDND